MDVWGSRDLVVYRFRGVGLVELWGKGLQGLLCP